MRFFLLTLCTAWELRRGCREFYRPQWKASEVAVTREFLRENLTTIEKAYPLTERRNFAIVNGTRWVYALNRKAGSKTWQKLLEILRKNGYDSGPYDKVRVFTYVRHPYGRLVSGYEEIIERHQTMCEKIPHCAAIMALRPDQERFEIFVREILQNHNFTELYGHLFYHVFSQFRSIARFDNVDFIGHLETMRDDFLSSIGSEKLLIELPELNALLDRDVLSSRFEKVKKDQNNLVANFSRLATDVQSIITTYYDQDFFCFNYSIDNITDLPWHYKSKKALSVSSSSEFQSRNS